MATDFENEMLEQTKKTNDLLKSLGGKMSSGGGSGGGGGGGGGGSSFGTGGFDALGGALTNAAGGLNSLWRGTLNVSSGFDGLTTAIQQNGGALGKVFGGISKDIGNAILETNKHMNTAGQVGANMNNDMAEYDRLIKGARMTHEQYNDMVKKGAVDLDGLGSTVNRSQKNFLEVTKVLQEGNVAAKMKEMGLSAEEVTEVAKASMAHQRGMDMSDETNKRRAAEAAMNLAASMEETTRITGMSRKQQMDALEKSQADARTKIALSRMDKGAQDRFRGAMSDSAGMGDAFKIVLKETLTGGIKSEEGRNAMAALGTSAADVQRYALSLKDSSVEGQKRSQELGNIARSRTEEWNMSEGASNLGQFGEGGAAEMFRKDYDTDNMRETVRAKIDENKGNIDVATAMKMQKDEVRHNIVGENEKGEAIKTPGHELATTINKADRALSDLSAGTSEVFGKLIEKSNGLVQSFGNLNEVLKPRTQEQSNPSELLSGAVDQFKSKIPFHDAYNKGVQNRSNEKTTPDQLVAPVEKISRASGSPTLDSFLNGSGSFNDMFEHFDPKGTPAELHGTELVATQAQMKKLVERLVPNMQASAAPKPEAPPSTTDATSQLKLPVQPAPAIASVQQTVAPPTAKSAFSPEFETNFIKTVADRFEKALATAFEPAVKNLHAQAAKVAQPQPAEVKQPEVKKEIPKVEPKKEEVKPEVKKEEVKPAEPKPIDDKFAQLSKTIDAVTDEIQSGGIKTKEGAEKMASLGPAGMDLQKAILAHKNATTDQQKADAINAENTAVAKIKEYQSSKAATDMQVYASKEKLKAENTVAPIKTSAELNNMLFGNPEGLKTSLTPAPKDEKDKEKAREEGQSIIDQMSKQSPINGMMTDMKSFVQNTEKNGEVISSKIAESVKLPDFESTFKGLSEQISGSITTILPSLDNTDQLKDAMEVFKSPDYTEFFTSMTDNLSSVVDNTGDALELDEETDDDTSSMFDSLPDFGEILSNAGSSISTGFDELFSDEEKPEEGKDESSMFDGFPSISGMFESVGNSLSSAFKSDKPSATSGNVKYEAIPQAEIDARNKKALEGIGKVETDPATLKALDAERARQADPTRFKQKEVPKPEPAKINDTHQSVATIKSYDLSHPSISAQSLKHPEPQPAPKPPVIEPPKPVEQVKPQVTATHEITLKDLHEALMQLNKTMGQMAQHTDNISSNSRKQIDATSSLSNSRW